MQYRILKSFIDPRTGIKTIRALMLGRSKGSVTGNRAKRNRIFTAFAVMAR